MDGTVCNFLAVEYNSFSFSFCTCSLVDGMERFARFRWTLLCIGLTLIPLTTHYITLFELFELLQ